MTPSNELINEWLKLAEAAPGPRFRIFAALAAAWGAEQEREACAKVCEDEAGAYDALVCAAAIRKRGEGGA